jgi:hypothetical protein
MIGLPKKSLNFLILLISSLSILGHVYQLLGCHQLPMATPVGGILTSFTVRACVCAEQVGRAAGFNLFTALPRQLRTWCPCIALQLLQPHFPERLTILFVQCMFVLPIFFTPQHIRLQGGQSLEWTSDGAAETTVGGQSHALLVRFFMFCSGEELRGVSAAAVPLR